MPLITAPYLSRVLEPDGIGTASYVESVVSYFVLFATMEITTYGQREISYVQYVQEERRRRSIAFWNTKILGACSAMISLTQCSFRQKSLLAECSRKPAKSS